MGPESLFPRQLNRPDSESRALYKRAWEKVARSGKLESRAKSLLTIGLISAGLAVAGCAPWANTTAAPTPPTPASSPTPNLTKPDSPLERATPTTTPEVFSNPHRIVVDPNDPRARKSGRKVYGPPPR
jgi:hypothetical protein